MIALYLASLAGAILFFVAGGAAMALRHRNADSVTQAQHVQLVQQRDAAVADASRLRHTLERVASSDFDDRSTVVQSDQEVTMLRARVEHAESLARNMAALRTRAEAAEAALEPLRKTEAQLRAELDRARRDAKVASAGTEQRAADVEKIRKELAAANQTVQELRTTAARDLEKARTDATALRGEVEQIDARLREAEVQLADRTQTIRDLSAENEQLKGRLGDAEALRADYVRLRTASTETAFLKSEVARLEGELRAMKVEALGGQRRRPARGTPRQVTQPNRSIGESLSGVIDRFSDAGTRSVAIADPAGFPLAATGDDGQSLAAYAALLLEAASRASQILPVAAPSTVEIVDDHGARISVWTFAVDSERLLLANLAVAPADTARVETALSELSSILAPAPLKTTATP